jgi:phage shock protein A
MLNRMMKKTLQEEQLESLKREFAELGEENHQLKERLEELESKVRDLQPSSSLINSDHSWSKSNPTLSLLLKEVRVVSSDLPI